MKKTCTKCGIEKSLAEGFYADRRHGDGRRSACRECCNAVSAVWGRANPEKTKQIRAKWQRANPEKANANTAKRKAIMLACEGQHYTAVDVMILLESQAGLCAYCGRLMDRYHVEHIVPLSRGGDNGRSNICLACPPCNFSKGSKLLDLEWTPNKVLDTAATET